MESQYQTKPGKILSAKKLTSMEKYFKIELPKKANLNYAPGQFVMVSIPGIGEAPISLTSSPSLKGCFELVVRNAGSLTSALHKMEKGDTVGIRGPFGKGFPIDVLEGNDLLFVAGGLGIVPLRSLINYVLDNRRDFGKISILLGCKTPQDMLFGDEIEIWERRVDVEFNCTVDKSDPDWKGNVGLITSLIPHVDLDSERTFAIICGPPIMYKFVIQELIKKEIPESQIILSLERNMKCGVGKCGHCQLGGYYCCQQGPVFTFEEIKGKHEAL